MRWPALLVQRGDEGVDDLRIELRACSFAKLCGGFINSAGPPIGTSGCDRIERVGDRDDPGQFRNFSTNEAHRVSAAIEALMVVHDAGQCLSQEADIADNLQTAHRM